MPTTLAEIWRYPVKSMQGERLEQALLADYGLLGDRVYAIRDAETGYIASAKHPRKWQALLNCHARFVAPPSQAQPTPPVLITLPNSATVHSADPDGDRALSAAFGRPVQLVNRAPAQPLREANRAPVDSSDSTEAIRQEPLALAAPVGTFFDYAVVHLITTATLARLQAACAEANFAVRRFRPNLVLHTPTQAFGFIENDWLGQRLSIGASQLDLIDPCPRCLVTTLAQPDLLPDSRVLRTVAALNAVASVTLAPGVVFPAVAGAYARVAHAAMIQLGDAVVLNEPR
jgi:uncharacterized protein YcbX